MSGNNSTPPLNNVPNYNPPNTTVRNTPQLSSIPTPVASFNFRSRNQVMNVKTPPLKKSKTRRSVPLSSNQVRRKMGQPRTYQLWSNQVNLNNNSVKRQKLTFASNTKNANTQPLNGGRRRKTRRHVRR